MTRVIAGSARGVRLATPAGAATRPTSDRVREAVFSALASWAGSAAGPAGRQLAGLGFLDLCAGSGAVGLEAASRGAGPVTLVESHRPTAALAARNAALAGLEAAVVTAEVAGFLARRAPGAPAYDLVWLDPPYALPGGELAGWLRQVVDGGWLGLGGLVLVERSVRSGGLDWPAALGERWTKVYGETAVHFAQAAG